MATALNPERATGTPRNPERSQGWPHEQATQPIPTTSIVTFKTLDKDTAQQYSTILYYESARYAHTRGIMSDYATGTNGPTKTPEMAIPTTHNTARQDVKTAQRFHS